jgi:hypothetical protein
MNYPHLLERSSDTDDPAPLAILSNAPGSCIGLRQITNSPKVLTITTKVAGFRFQCRQQ